jgi:hypothetical protein
LTGNRSRGRSSGDGNQDVDRPEFRLDPLAMAVHRFERSEIPLKLERMATSGPHVGSRTFDRRDVDIGDGHRYSLSCQGPRDRAAEPAAGAENKSSVIG